MLHSCLSWLTSNTLLMLRCATLFSFSIYFQHALDATLFSFSSSFQHALDATIFSVLSYFQHTLEATISSFSSIFQHALDATLFLSQAVSKFFLKQFPTLGHAGLHRKVSQQRKMTTHVKLHNHSSSWKTKFVCRKNMNVL